MRAVCWMGKRDVRVENVPDPVIVNARDAIVRVTATAICGSDLHLYSGFIPTMREGDVLGHEFMGEVVEVGSAITRLSPGERVVVPFTISCGRCGPCEQKLFALCDNSNPNAWMAEKLYGFSGAGLFGFSHLFGGYPGGQAEYVRVPFADVGAIKIPDGVSDERALFLSDILPTGWMAAENAGIRQGDTVAIWGAGPVGFFTAIAAGLLGAERIISIDRVPERLDLVRRVTGATVIDIGRERDVVEALRELTGGRGPDACIDAVGMEAHGRALDALYDRAKQGVRLTLDRSHALREAVQACKKGGTVSIPGVYAGLLDKFPLGAAFAKGLTLRMGQTHVQKYAEQLLERIVTAQIDPSLVISHRMSLEDAPRGYELFRSKEERCTKVVLQP